jgi:threonine/homoserine/homoserine lactone efflux protein
MIRNLAIGLIFMYLIYVGIHLLTSGNKEEELKDALRSLLYISIGSLFIYGAGWFFGDILNF